MNFITRRTFRVYSPWDALIEFNDFVSNIWYNSLFGRIHHPREGRGMGIGVEMSRRAFHFLSCCSSGHFFSITSFTLCPWRGMPSNHCEAELSSWWFISLSFIIVSDIRYGEGSAREPWDGKSCIKPLGGVSFTDAPIGEQCGWTRSSAHSHRNMRYHRNYKMQLVQCLLTCQNATIQKDAFFIQGTDSVRGNSYIRKC